MQTFTFAARLTPFAAKQPPPPEPEENVFKARAARGEPSVPDIPEAEEAVPGKTAPQEDRAVSTAAAETATVRPDPIGTPEKASPPPAAEEEAACLMGQAEALAAAEKRHFPGVVLDLGLEGEDVRRLQSFLPGAEESGVFDEPTQAAVRLAQRRAGLPESGPVDAATWEAILFPPEGEEQGE